MLFRLFLECLPGHVEPGAAGVVRESPEEALGTKDLRNLKL